MENIEEIRKKIDSIDIQLVDLLNQRAELAFQIKKIKLANNMPILDAEREDKIHKMIKSRSNGLLNEEELERIYSLILEVMRGIEIDSQRTEGRG